MKGVVLCAGYGTRMGELTRELPKPMLAVGGVPILEHILRNLARHGIWQIAINLHFGGEILRDHFKSGARLGVRLAYFVEPELLGTAGAVRNMRRFLGGDEPFVVHYGDVLTDHDMAKMATVHRQHGGQATILVHERLRSNSAVDVDSAGAVVAFHERPKAPLPPPGPGFRRRVFSGVCICEPGVIDAIPAAVPSDLPRDVFPALARAGALFAHPLSGRRWAIDSRRRLLSARAAAESGRLQAA
jgi:NDP-sugar pyrophosphorylase family protein